MPRRKKLGTYVAKVLRELRGDTPQRAMAERAGISRQTLLRAERGGDIRLASFAALCRALGATPSDVMFDAECRMQPAGKRDTCKRS